ncbi:MAG: hypothetical protein CXZ00_06300 [Acidobacteria bacterium]|nr:MAG: hypothetical protein CXZ00_06300 [Acidobacteriota bacterium]
MKTRKLLIAFSLFAIAAFTQPAVAQSLEKDHPDTHGLNWDGVTGGVMSPIAYTLPAPKHGFGKPAVKFNYWNGGPVIGNFYNVSITQGWGNRVEYGYTHQFNSSGNGPYSALSKGSYTTVHGKVLIVNEKKWIPAVAVGAVGRFGDKHGDTNWNAIVNNNPHWGTQPNGDFYVVATKIKKLNKNLAIGLVMGEMLTNAVAHGLPGAAGNGINRNTQRWQGTMFGGGGFMIPGPAHSRILFAGEFMQEPHYIQPFGDWSSVKTSTAYGMRIYPHLEGYPLQIDVGVLLAAGQLVAPGKTPMMPNGLDLDCRSRVGFGLTYHLDGKKASALANKKH